VIEKLELAGLSPKEVPSSTGLASGKGNPFVFTGTLGE